MLKKILIVLAVIITVFLALAAMQPNEFSVTRSVTIFAPAATVFAQVNDLHKWTAWSPWEKMDPQMKRTYEGAPAGNGSIYSWAGNANVGEGRMTILESRPDESIRIKLEFFKPFAGTNTAEFSFQGQGNKTVVTWSMFGPNSFIGKAMGLLINCQQMVGGQFEQGLADLKSVSENATK